MKKFPVPQFSPEQELLLWSIRVDHTKEEEITKILKSGVDWDYVRETAIQHGIIPLLYKRLKDEMSDLIPPEKLNELQTLFVGNAVNNIRRTQHLLKVLALLAESGVEAMPFKGPALAIQAYGDLSMRSFDDLDILIHEKDRNLVFHLLVDHGCTLESFSDSRIERKLRLKQMKDIHFFCQNEFLEIHWDITERLLAAPFDMDSIWARSLPILLNNQKVRTLSPEDMVIVLCFHGTKHAWQDLKWLADLIYMISSHPEIRWNEVLDYSRNIGVERIVFLGLSLALEYGGIRNFPEIEGQIESDETIQTLKFQIQTNIFHSGIWGTLYTQELFYLKSRERSRDKMRFLLYSLTDRILTPNRNDFDCIRLPELLFPLYVIIRPVRLMIDYVRGNIPTLQTK
jgi:hypothetical protein